MFFEAKVPQKNLSAFVNTLAATQNQFFLSRGITMDTGPSGRDAQSWQDRLFEERNPHETRWVEAHFGLPHERWDRVRTLQAEMMQIADVSGVPYESDARAKSNSSIWHKLHRFPFELDPREIFDVYGVRFVTPSPDAAQKLAHHLASAYTPMSPHRFAHDPARTHEPWRDHYANPTPSGFKNIAFNPMTRFGIAEVQVCDIQSYSSYLQKHPSIAYHHANRVR